MQRVVFCGLGAAHHLVQHLHRPKELGRPLCFPPSRGSAGQRLQGAANHQLLANFSPQAQAFCIQGFGLIGIASEQRYPPQVIEGVCKQGSVLLLPEHRHGFFVALARSRSPWSKNVSPRWVKIPEMTHGSPDSRESVSASSKSSVARPKSPPMMHLTASPQWEIATPLTLPASWLSARLSSSSSVARSNSPRLTTTIARALRRSAAALSPLPVRKSSTPSSCRPSSPAPTARSKSPKLNASQVSLCSALARAAFDVRADVASASSSHLRPSLRYPRKYQNQPSAAANRSPSSES